LSDPAQPPQSAAERETTLALRNSVKLGLSLLATLTVAIAVRFWIPRALGPEAFGRLHFAESLAVIAFLFTTLGFDTWLRKEAATDAKAAEAYLGGVMVLRALLSLLACGVMMAVLMAMGKLERLWLIALAFAGFQAARIANESLASLLEASGRVDRIALAKPAMKLVWGAGAATVLLLRPRIELVALVFVVAESLTTLVYAFLVRREIGVTFRVDLRAAKGVVAGSLGFFVNYLVHRAYERLDVQMLGVMATDDEVGFYGAAANLALAGLLFLPVVNSVVLPMGARIATEDVEQMNQVMRNAVRLVFVIGAAPSLMLVLFSGPVVALAFGEAFAPTSLAIGTLGLVLPLTYVAVVANMHLIQLDKVWTMTRISIVGLVLNPVLNLVLIPWGLARFNAGGGGFGAALATLGTEVVVVGLAWITLGRAGMDRKLAWGLLRTVGLCALVAWVHSLLPGLGLWRLPLDLIVFGAVGVVTGAIPLADVLALLRRVKGRASSE
jgi:O-antigen/teichoic acid export membrane protein